MKLIEREQLDIERWDALVFGSPDYSVFSLSFYLDVVSENWCIYVDDEYTRGIALPYVIRLGMRHCYTPTFVRYLEWFGLPIDDYRFMLEMKRYFPSGKLQTKHKIRTKGLSRRVYQRVEGGEVLEFNNQTKRMLDKFERSGTVLKWSNDDISSVMQYIRSELPLKVMSLDKRALNRLEKLAAKLLEKKMLKILLASDGDRNLGGLFLVVFNGNMLYLKGAVNREAKTMGVMYGAMQKAIYEAHSDGLIFDFGGSNADGVKRFNYNLGGEDVKYYAVEWDKTPPWFRWIMKIRNSWRRKQS